MSPRVILMTLLVCLAGCTTSPPKDVNDICAIFKEKGGWLVDPQFVEQMGSPYLLAHGLGKAVNDAKTTF